MSKDTYELVVLVTGVEAKLANDLAKEYARRKARIIVQSNAEKHGLVLDLLVHEIVSQGGVAVPSVHSISQTMEIMKDVKEHFDQVDILIAKLPEEVDSNDWTNDLEDQLLVIYRLVNECMKYFQRQKFGRIVFIASHRGILDPNSSITFSLAKSALLGLCLSIVAVGKSSNILCNTLLINEDIDDGFYCENLELISNLTKAESTETGAIISSRDELLCLKEYSKLHSLSKSVNEEPLENRVAIVTGTSSGIGFYLVKTLLKMGATVIAYENNMMRQWSRPNFEQTNENKRRSLNLLAFKRNSNRKDNKLEFIDSMDEPNLIEFVMKRYGRIDILFNSSTVPISPRHSELHEYSWDLMLRYRLESAYAITQLVLPIMQKQYFGRIVLSGPNVCCESIRYGLIGLVEGISGFLNGSEHDIKVNSLFVDIDFDLKDGNATAILASQLIEAETPFQNQHFDIRNNLLTESQFIYQPYIDSKHRSVSPHTTQIFNRSYSASSSIAFSSKHSSSF